MTHECRDVVSSVASAVLAAVGMLVFCFAAGMPAEQTVQAAVLVGAVVSASDLVRHGLLLIIEHKYGPCDG